MCLIEAQKDWGKKLTRRRCTTQVCPGRPPCAIMAMAIISRLATRTLASSTCFEDREQASCTDVLITQLEQTCYQPFGDGSPAAPYGVDRENIVAVMIMVLAIDCGKEGEIGFGTINRR